MGLCTLDVIQLVDRIPGPDEKVVALDVSVAAGGPAANAAVVFAALGGRTTLVTRIGEDPAGAVVLEDLRAHGVEVVSVPGASSTTVASILVTRGTGERAVVSATDRGRSSAVTGEVDLAHLVAAVDPAVVLIDSHEIDLSLPIAREATGRSVPVVLDCGAKKAHTDRQLPDVTVAVVSEAYLPSGAVADLRGHEVPFGAVTRGGGPITFWMPGSLERELEVPAVTAVDTLGAGDFFHGALAHAIAGGGLSSFPGAVRQAADVAALSVRQLGTRSWLQALPNH